MVAVLKPITQRVIQQPAYVQAESFEQWLRLNQMLAHDYWSELDDGTESAADFMAFAASQYDVHCASLDESDDDASPRRFRTTDEAAAYDAAVPARGEI